MYHSVFDTASLREEVNCGRTFYLSDNVLALSFFSFLHQIRSKINSVKTLALTLNISDVGYLPQGHFSLPGAEEMPYGLCGGGTSCLVFLTVIRRCNINPSQQSKLGKERWRLYR